MDGNMRRYKYIETKEKIYRKKDKIDMKERQCGCIDVI